MGEGVVLEEVADYRDVRERKLIIGKAVTMSVLGLRLPGSDTHRSCANLGKALLCVSVAPSVMWG